MAWLTNEQLIEMGFASFGKSVMLSDKASYYNCKNIRLGSNVRIDDFCVLSAGYGGIDIGNYIHIAVFSSLIGAGNIKLADFSNISSRVSIYSSNDDYSGATMTNPTIPAEFTNVHHADVNIGRHAIIGAGTIILPGVTLEEAVAVGALSLVKKDCQAFGIYIGSPVERIAERKQDLLELEKKFTNSRESV
ncbi:acyltransferase [Crenothrix sp.]|uniref:acyltransferase n=1 Tax=Crenothrix sp. TaxID=3100433 RepID=UPI00374DBA35